MSGDAFAAAVAEHRGSTPTFTFRGEEFEVSPGISALAWLELSAYAEVNLYSTEGATAMLNFARDVFTEESWPRFTACARRHKLDQDELLEAVSDAAKLVLGRPTTPSSGSDSGSSSTTPPSTASSSAKARRKASSA